MSVLDDGSVVPSFLGVQVDSGASGYDVSVNDPYLRVGRVSRVHRPTDDSNQSKRFIEYDVEVDYSRSSSDYSRIVYPRARIASVFGAVGDFLRYTPRVVDTDPDKITTGALVLVICINGDTRQAVIVGGIPHPKLAKDNPDADGHNLAFEFNGAGVRINKDGELAVTFRGATAADGKLGKDADTAAEGSTVTFKKNGSVEIATKEDNQHIVVDHAKKRVDIKSDSEVFVSSNGNVNIESAGTHLGGSAATEALVMGTTYRQQETVMNNQLAAGLATLMGLLSTAGGSLTAAASVHAVPIAGPIIGAPAIATAAAAIVAAGPVVATMQAAITAFELSSALYLSKKNTTD